MESRICSIPISNGRDQMFPHDAPVLLDVEHLQVQFRTPNGIARPVNGLNFQVHAGETIAIVGESGCGKSVTAMSVLRLFPKDGARVSGSVSFRGRDLFELPEREMRAIRGKEIAMIFQDPVSSLNPVQTVGRQICETLGLHQHLRGTEARRRAVELLALVGIADPERRISEYPHQMSGGMCQRVMIAMALACDPQILIADEPTTALDVTIQAQILDLMRKLKERTGAAVLLITHDFGVVWEVADRVLVMYAGKVVEEASTANLFGNPRHPYTRGLLGAIPGAAPLVGGRLAEIPGTVPSATQKNIGCAFAGRCGQATDICRNMTPALEAKGPAHYAACHHVLSKEAAA